MTDVLQDDWSFKITCADCNSYLGRAYRQRVPDEVRASRGPDLVDGPGLRLIWRVDTGEWAKIERCCRVCADPGKPDSSDAGTGDVKGPVVARHRIEAVLDEMEASGEARREYGFSAGGDLNQR